MMLSHAVCPIPIASSWPSLASLLLCSGWRGNGYRARARHAVLRVRAAAAVGARTRLVIGAATTAGQLAACMTLVRSNHPWQLRRRH